MDEPFLLQYVSEMLPLTNNDDTFCFLCSQSEPPQAIVHEPKTSHLPPLPLGCACTRNAHVLCAYRMYAPSIEFSIQGTIWSRLDVQFKCFCVHCSFGLNHNLIRFFMKHAFCTADEMDERALSAIRGVAYKTTKEQSFAQSLRSFLTKVFS